jgi:alkylhydroperoxidase family enzyme
MSRLPTPASIEASPAASQPLLQAVKKQLGVVPNMFRLVGNSPAALEGYLGLNGALAKGALEATTRERIALAVAEITANRDGGSTDQKAEAAVHFAVKLVNARGHVSDADIKAVKDAGYTDAQVIEIVLHVALNTLTNYVNEMAKTEIDFPVVTARAA